MTESEIQREILIYLVQQRDFYFWRNQSVGVYADGAYRRKGVFEIKGVSDILGIHRASGKLIAIEVKKDEKAKRSREQVAFINKMNDCNGFACFVWSLDQVKIFLEKIRNTV